MAAIIIDKNILQGSRGEHLQRFCAKHVLLLPQALLYEICTEDKTTNGPPQWSILSRKLQCLRFDVCRTLPDMFAEEIRRGLPIASIVDEDATRRLREYLDAGPAAWASPPLFITPEERRRHQEEVVDCRKDMLKLVDEDEGARELLRQVREIACAKECTTARALVAATKDLTHDLWRKRRPQYACLATVESVTYMDVVLRNYQEFRRADDGYADMHSKSLFNEAVDRGYIVLLVHADGLVSDEGSVRKTAGAFFPDKLVWANLQEGLDWGGISGT